MLAVWSFLVEPALLVVNREELPLGRTPPALRGLKIAAISDIHAGSPHINIEKLNRLVEETNRLQPDLVVLLGDYVIQDVAGGKFIEPEATAECLSRLHAPLGVFAVLGNHDWWLDGERVGRALTSVGIKVLENDAARVVRDGHPLWVAGLADLWTRSPDTRKA
ncbi:MAG TPA: metallophosphoesterase, partial [Pyrinomonadaceae bacterium]|nr:metallophosphoesterase [Pyrinomonadaceae bacterium]